ncbi:hypothetical protein D3Z47_15150 [Lachnospiraceae bacterium]|nr:hypothetical protein [Lachnospiraceae bacterium]
MKCTGNQKVVTTAKWLLLAVQRKTPPYCQNPFVKALSAQYRACIALPDKNTVYAVTRENRDLWSVCIGILKGRERIVIQFTDFKSGNYRRGLCPSGFKSAPGKSWVLAGRLCVLVTDISGERLIRE